MTQIAPAAELAGKVALVTGSGRGLGRACAELFARKGASVIVADVDATGGEETAALIRAEGGAATFVRADVADEDSVAAMVQAAVATYGGLDCAINNAVIALPRPPLADMDDNDWDRGLAINFTGVFLCMKHEIRAMLMRGGGAIVNIGSGNEYSARPGLAWYLGAKQGVYGMTKCAALDYAKQGIRINAVGPGTMWTPGLRAQAERNPKHIETVQAYSPLNRIAEPEEVAAAAVWLCTAKASFVLGHTLVADGGAVLN